VRGGRHHCRPRSRPTLATGRVPDDPLRRNHAPNGYLMTHYLAVGATRATVSAEVVAEFAEDIESLARL